MRYAIAMLTNVRTKNRLPTEKTVRVVHRAGAGAPDISVTLRMPAGVLSIAAQTTSLGHQASIVHDKGMEIVFANESPHPRVSVIRHSQDGAVAVRHVAMLEHAVEVEHLDPATSVKGLEGLALHLIRHQHGFDGRARPPLPLDLAADPAPRIRAMGLSVPTSDAAALASFGLCLTATAAPRAPRSVSTPGAEGPKVRVHAGVEKFTSFFFFNTNIVSRLSAYFPTKSLAYARGVGVNMALGATMQVSARTPSPALVPEHSPEH